MTLLEILNEKAIRIGLQRQRKEEIIAELVDILEPRERVKDRQRVLEAVLERESRMSTGIGNGIAIPHGKSEFVAGLVVSLGTQREGANFDTLDGEPAYIFCLLVSPLDVSDVHIKALASISRLLGNEDCRKALLEARTPQEVLSVIAQRERSA